MGIKDEALALIKEQQAEAARAEALRLNPPPAVWGFSLDADTATAVREVVNEYRKAGIRPVPLVEEIVTHETVKVKWWSSKTALQTTTTIKPIMKGWLLTYQGSNTAYAVTEDGHLVSLGSPTRGQDGIRRYSETSSVRMGMHTVTSHYVSVMRGYGPVERTYITLQAAGGESIDLTREIVVRVSYSSNSDDRFETYDTLHKVLVESVAALNLK